MKKRILIAIKVMSDIRSNCYVETGVKPSEWRQFLEHYVKEAMGKRYGPQISGYEYDILTRWSDDPDLALDGELANTIPPDNSVIIAVQEIMADAWHDFLSNH